MAMARTLGVTLYSMVFIGLLIIFLGIGTNALCATYYISPTGNDTNAGTLAAPWRLMQKAANTMRAGDTLLVRDGAYPMRTSISISGTATQYITYKNYPGEKPIIDGTGIAVSSAQGLITINRANYIRIEGVEVKNSTGNGILLMGLQGAPILGTKLKNVYISNPTIYGIQATYAEQYEFDSVEIDGKSKAGNGGFHLGAWSCNNGILRNCIAHDLGDQPGAQSGGADVQIGFWAVNARNISFINCKACNNEGDGFDLGLYNATESNATDSIKYINCTAYNNADGYGMNSGEGVQRIMHLFFVNCIAYSNSCVNFHAYGGPAEYTWVNCLSYDGGECNYGACPDGWADFGSMVTHMYNCVGYKPSGEAFPRSNLRTTYIKGMNFTLDSDNNYWGQKKTEFFCQWDCFSGTDPYVSQYTYSDVGSMTSNWYLLDEDGHLHCDGHSLSSAHGDSARFNNEASFDYTLKSNSSLRGKGLDLKSKPFYIPEMAYDRNGKLRINFDIGPYEYSSTEIRAPECSDLFMQPDIRISPNPLLGAKEVLIQLGESFFGEGNKKLKIYDLSGRVIFEREIKGQQLRWNAGQVNIQKGIYLLSVEGNHSIVSQKIVVLD